MIMHATHQKPRDNALARLGRLTSYVERLHDVANIYRDVREMTRNLIAKQMSHNDAGQVISNSAEQLNYRPHHCRTGYASNRYTEKRDIYYL